MGTWHGFNIIDGIVAVFLAAGLIGGVRRGLSGELARAAIAVACIVVAAFYGRPLADWAMQRFAWSPRTSYLTALLALLLGVYLASSLLRMVLGRLVDFQFKGRIERIGGGFCGLLRSGVVVSVFLLLLSLMPNDKLRDMITLESRSGQLVCPHMRPMYESLSDRVPELRIPDEPAGEIYDPSQETDPAPVLPEGVEPPPPLLPDAELGPVSKVRPPGGAFPLPLSILRPHTLRHGCVPTAVG